MDHTPRVGPDSDGDGFCSAGVAPGHVGEPTGGASTRCDSVSLLGSKVPSPPYEAVSVRSPGDVKVMAQLPSATLALHDSPPSDAIVTVPVGVPASEVTRNSTVTA